MDFREQKMGDDFMENFNSERKLFKKFTNEDFPILTPTIRHQHQMELDHREAIIDQLQITLRQWVIAINEKIEYLKPYKEEKEWLLDLMEQTRKQVYCQECNYTLTPMMSCENCTKEKL